MSYVVLVTGHFLLGWRLTSLVNVWVKLMLKHLLVGMISGNRKEREGLKVSQGPERGQFELKIWEGGCTCT